MDRRTAIATIGAITVSSSAGCLGESGESGVIEHTRTSNPVTRRSPVYGNVAMRLIDFKIEIPPEGQASIEVNLTRTANGRLSIENVSGSGTLDLFTEDEYDKFKEGETAHGYSITSDGSVAYKDGFVIDNTRQVLVASNVGLDETGTEETFEGEATITERLPPTQQFNYPAVD